jgi:hypothetical protein
VLRTRASIVAIAAIAGLCATLTTAVPAAAAAPRTAVVVQWPGVTTGDPDPSGTTYSADQWSEVAVNILVANKGAIGWCASSLAFISYGALRALRAAALRDKIYNIASLAAAGFGDHCVVAYKAARAALKVWTIGHQNRSDFTFQDDSYVVIRRWRSNLCYLDITVGEPAGGSWRYRWEYKRCADGAYGGGYIYG